MRILTLRVPTSSVAFFCSSFTGGWTSRSVGEKLSVVWCSVVSRLSCMHEISIRLLVADDQDSVIHDHTTITNINIPH
ncbi:hypothetical protein DFH29DRAFT_891479 [Suillus ampliporus]|nr:hypothetical protein DFH29DRAFT_891479 [Suillus ampliporus]